MPGEHWFWWLLTVACVVWYSTITVFVAVRGVVDIKGMLARLADDAPDADGSHDRPVRKEVVS